MFTFHSVTLILPLLAVGISQNIPSQEPCTLNNNEIDGLCILLPLCAQALALLKLNDIKSLKTMSCGFEGMDIKVCCPNNTTDNLIVFKNYTEEIATSRPKTIKTTTAGSNIISPSTILPTAPATSESPSVVNTSANNEIHMTNKEERINPNTNRLPRPKLPSSIPISVESPTLPPSPILPNILPDRSTCGLYRIEDRILGGEISTIDEFPWIVIIKYRINSKEIYGCSGTLITDRYVLTAAHCVFNLTIVDVRLGEWDIETEIDCYGELCNNPPVDLKIDKAIMHPKFNRRDVFNADIALLRLERPVNFTDFIRPVCLPSTDYIAKQDYIPESTFLTAGWGQTEYDSRSSVIRKLQLDAVPMSVCRVAHPIPENATNNIICAGGKQGKDSCRGDSGGPLLKLVQENYSNNWFLFGITSYGYRVCGTEGRPGVYTRITSYMDWILENISQ